MIISFSIPPRHSLSLIVVPYSHFLRGHRLAWSRIPTQLRYRPGALAVVGSNPTGPIMYMGSNIDKDVIKYEGSEELIPFTLQTITKKIESMPNAVNRSLVNEFYSYMAKRELSKNHQINNLKVVMSYADYLGQETSFHDVNKKDQILDFLDTKKKDAEKDPERKWITTWNYYLNRLKLFFRWLYNRGTNVSDELDMSDWKTPEFVQIKF